MTLPADLDTWGAALATATGLPVTRDPALIHPPCLYLALPDVTAATLTAVTLLQPVYLVARGSGLQTVDQLVGNIGAVLSAITGATEAAPATLTVGAVDYSTYLIAARLTATLEI